MQTTIAHSQDVNFKSTEIADISGYEETDTDPTLLNIHKNAQSASHKNVPSSSLNNDEINTARTKHMQAIKQIKKPLRIAYYFIHHPCKVIIFIVSLMSIVLVVDVFGFKFSRAVEDAYFVKGDPQVHRMHSLTLAKEHLASSSTKLKPKTQDIRRYTFVIMYKTRDGRNILQPSNIADYIEFIIETNNKIPNTDHDAYYSFCLADTTDSYATYPDCSSKAVWDPIVATFGNVNYHNITQQDIDNFVNLYLNNPYMASGFLSSFEEGFEDTKHSQYYRAFYRFGLPHPDINETVSSYRDATDREKEQNEYYEKWAYPIFRDIQIEQNQHNNVEVVMLGRDLREIQLSALTNSGIAFAAGSIITVFGIMWWHLNSVFLAAASMVQILFGFPFAFGVYRYLFRITFFDTLNTLVVFLVLGIGADDVFVFVDAWVQSAHFVPRGTESTDLWLVKRMDFAYRRAAKAMIVTTATTFFAFMATATSPIMPIAAFGVWAACVVLLNYTMVISLFPAILSYWYQNIRSKERCPSCCIRCCACFKNNASETKSPSPANRDNEETVSTEVEPRCMEKFLSEKWAPWINKASWIILPVAFIALGFAIYIAKDISPLTQQEEWFEEDHYMTKMHAWQEHFDGGAVQSLINVQIVWGLKDTVDDSDVTFWDAEYLGHVQFDDTFDASSYDAQRHLQYVCDVLCTNYSSLLYDPADYFSCWVYDFREYGESLGLQYPFMWSDDAQVQSDMYNELISGWWTQTQIGTKYASLGEIGLIDNELKFTYIEFKIPYVFYMHGKDVIFAEYEDIMTDFNEIAPEGVNKGYQTSSFAWAWMKTEDSFVTSAVQGVGIATPLALLCLILSTQNLIVSLYATSAIVGIIAFEVALMVLQGSELGISESIAVVMIVGFSVDYVVHIGNAYIECEESGKRFDRLKFSLYTMGISVVSGALTTFGSGFWLIFPEFIFFKKIGILVMSVVTFSLFFSMVYFTSLLAKCGPQGKRGYFPIIPWVMKLLKPLSKCVCCQYLCFLCGTMDDLDVDQNERKMSNKKNNKSRDMSNEKGENGEDDKSDAETRVILL